MYPRLVPTNVKKKQPPKKKKVIKVVKKVKKQVKKVPKATPKKKPVRPVSKKEEKVPKESKKPLLKKAEILELKAHELINKGKKRGFITYDEILKIFPDIENNIFFLDELYEKLAVSGIDVLEGGNLLDVDKKDALESKYAKDAATYDSIQMYLKEIGQYPLIHEIGRAHV